MNDGIDFDLAEKISGYDLNHRKRIRCSFNGKDLVQIVRRSTVRTYSYKGFFGVIFHRW